MTKKLPSIYGLDIYNIKQKMDFYNDLKIKIDFVKYPMLLIQSLELGKARYSFYKDKGIKIDSNNYSKLFIRQQQFKDIYNIDNKTLMFLYNEEEDNNGKRIKV